MAESFLPPVIVELGGQDTGAIKAIDGLIKALARVPEAAKAAADAMRLVQESAVAMAEGIKEPLDSAKSSIRGVASAMRALSKTAQTTDDDGRTAMEQLGTSAKEMGTAVTEGATAAKASLTELTGELKTVGAEAKASAAEVTAAADEEAAAERASGDAAATAGKKKAEAAGEGSAALMKYGTALGATAFGIFEVVKSATSFNGELTKINTQAGVSKNQLGSLGNGVLNLAGQVGFSPDSLAEALYHVESSFASIGIKGPEALNITRIAAEGAAIGHANLVDVTNALDAAIASGIPGVKDYSQAMGALNAIIGSGDMQMQDLAKALGTGVLAVVKGYGVTLNDAGAALATFGDNNIRGATAATNLRMAVQALAVPVKGGIDLLNQWGLSGTALGDDMRQHGLVHTLNMLHDLFIKNGVTATEQGQVITEMFGKKAGSGLAVLMGQLDRVNSKVPEIAKSASGFGSAWETTSHTVGQEFNNLKGGLEALGVKIGTMLLPVMSKVLGLVQQGIGWITSHKSAVQALAAVIGGALVAALWGVVGALSALELNPVVLGITAVAGALIFAYIHFKAFRTVVNEVAGILKTVLVGAFHVVETVVKAVMGWFKGHSKEFSEAWAIVVHTVHALVKWFDDNVLKWIRGLIADLVAWWKAHSQEIGAVWAFIWKWIKTAFEVVWQGAIKPGLALLVAIWKFAWGIIKDSVMIVWGLIKGIITTAMHFIMNTIGVILDLLTGHWSKAWHGMLHLCGQLTQDIANTILGAVKGFGQLLWDAGKNVVMGLINGIKSMIGGVGGAMHSVASTIRSFLPFSPAKQGPLSGSGSPDLAGSKIGEMVADGMTRSATKVTRAGHSLAGAAKLALSGHGSDLDGLALTVAGRAAGPGGSGQLPPIVVQVDGKKLFEILQTQTARYSRRNPNNGLVVTNK